MRKFVFGCAIPLLSACLFGVENPPPAHPQAGAYRGHHGALTESRGFESELILDENGAFRYFLVDSNTAYYTAKGNWKAAGEAMTWSGISRSYYYHGGFRTWDTLANPDTSYLRKVTDTGFERLEVSYDTQFVSVLHWVEYRRIAPEKPLPEGVFEFTESHPDGVDSTLELTDLNRLEISRDGHFYQSIYRNGDLYMSDMDSNWTQAGTFLITSRNRHCEYEDGKSYCSDAPLDYEFVTRLSGVADSGFHFWLGADFTYQPNPYWAHFRKAP